MARPARIPRKTFYMIRHGQTEHNVSGVVSAPKVDLTDDGVEQAKELKKLVEANWDNPKSQCHLVTSKFYRARRTAGIAFDGVRQHPEGAFNEANNSSIAGIVDVDELVNLHDNHIGGPFVDVAGLNGYPVSTIDGKSVQIVGAESQIQHRRRTANALANHLKKTPDGQDLVVLSHQLTMREAAITLGFDSLKFGNAILYKFEPADADQWQLSEFGLEQGKVKEAVVAKSNNKSECSDIALS